VLYKNIERIVKGVNTRDRALFLRVLRCTVVVRCGVGATALAATVDRFVTDADLKSQILQLIDAIAKVRLAVAAPSFPAMLLCSDVLVGDVAVRAFVACGPLAVHTRSTTLSAVIRR
jgi:hypothetical protein